MTDTQSTPSPGSSRHDGEIIVAIDGSEGSRAALRWAAALGAPLRVVRSWEHPATIPLPWSRITSHTSEEVDEMVRTELEQVVAETLPADRTVAVEALRGPPGTALVAVASSRRPSMLVVGSRGQGGFRGLLLGSVSRQCLEHAPCPVIVVPGPERAALEPGISNIVVGLDRSPMAEDALRFTLELAARNQASVTTVHAFQPPYAEVRPEIVADLRSEAEQQFRTRCDSITHEQVRSECVVADGDPREILLEVARQRNANLLVVGAIGEGTVEQHLGPVASFLAAHATVPFAVVR